MYKQKKVKVTDGFRDDLKQNESNIFLHCLALRSTLSVFLTASSTFTQIYISVSHKSWIYVTVPCVTP